MLKIANRSEDMALQLSVIWWPFPILVESRWRKNCSLTQEMHSI